MHRAPLTFLTLTLLQCALFYSLAFFVEAQIYTLPLPADECLPYAGYASDPGWTDRCSPVDMDFKSSFQDGEQHITFLFAFQINTCFSVGQQQDPDREDQPDVPSQSELVYRPNCTWDEDGLAHWDKIDKAGGIKNLKEGMVLDETPHWRINLHKKYQGSLILKFHKRNVFGELQADSENLGESYQWLTVEKSKNGSDSLIQLQLGVHPFVRYLFHATDRKKWITDSLVIGCITTYIGRADEDDDFSEFVVECSPSFKGTICVEDRCGKKPLVIGTCSINVPSAVNVEYLRVSDKQTSTPAEWWVKNSTTTTLEMPTRTRLEIGIFTAYLDKTTDYYRNQFQLESRLCTKKGICADFAKDRVLETTKSAISRKIHPELIIQGSETPHDTHVLPASLLNVKAMNSLNLMLKSPTMKGDIEPALDSMVLQIMMFDKEGNPKGDLMHDATIRDGLMICHNRQADCDIAQEFKDSENPIVFVYFAPEVFKEAFSHRAGYTYKVHWEVSFVPRHSNNYQVVSSQKTIKANIVVSHQLGDGL